MTMLNNLHFEDLATYTMMVNEDRQFYIGDTYISIRENANVIEFDIANDNVLLRFENGKALVRVNYDTRKVMALDKVMNFLNEVEIDIMAAVESIPFLRKALVF